MFTTQFPAVAGNWAGGDSHAGTERGAAGRTGIGRGRCSTSSGVRAAGRSAACISGARGRRATVDVCRRCTTIDTKRGAAGNHSSRGPTGECRNAAASTA